ncbi:hypothetical protein [Rhodococcus sp. B50]|nr:hypothetical protein [Rhodococcus sp. B50]
MSLLEGVLFDHTHGTRAHASSGSATARIDEIRSTVGLRLDALCARR